MQFIVLFLLTIMISPIVTAYHFAVFAAMIVFGYGISLLCGNIMYPKALRDLALKALLSDYGILSSFIRLFKRGGNLNTFAMLRRGWFILGLIAVSTEGVSLNTFVMLFGVGSYCV